MKKVLIAGGCGFIGHKVAIEFLRANYDVVIVDNWHNYNVHLIRDIEEKYQQRIKKLKGAFILQRNVCNTRIIKQIFKEEKPDLVVHLANFPTATLAHKQPFFGLEQIVEGTLSLLEAAKSTNVQKFVYISSSMVYGDFQTSSVKEDHPQNPKELYGIFKVTAEHMVRSYTRLHNLTHSIVRPIAVYGPTGHDAFVITKFIKATKESGTIKILGKNTKLSFTFVDDMAQGIFKAATMPKADNESFNIGSGKSSKLVDIANYLKTLNPKVKIIIDEADPLYPKRGALNISKAIKLLGYAPKYSIEKGLKIFYDSI
ncbi:MAG: NAD-dependent epimerase/dehydratase family protein [Thermodesulfovibrionia bacterium]|nr:NAD-dependent epimerase/dehydratase family protein [Thermodesulfovibrionia bacterium]